MYANKTMVSPEKSIAQLKSSLKHFGAEGFSVGTLKDTGYIAFTYRNQSVKFSFRVPMPTCPSSSIAEIKKYEQASRTTWRLVLLCVRAKLESVLGNLETFEQAFMAHLIPAEGKLLGAEYRAPEKTPEDSAVKPPSKLSA